MHLNKFLRHLLLADASKYLTYDFIVPNCSKYITKREFHVSVNRMAQTSITSFFKFTPLKSHPGSKDKDVVKEETSPSSKDEGKKTSKRLRLESSGSESELLNKSKSSVTSSEKKKKPKRQRIESSGSESEPTGTPPSPGDKSQTEATSPSPIKSSPKEEKLKIKVENTDSPKTYASPKSKKGKAKVKDTKNVKKEKSPKKAETQDSPRNKSPSPASKKVKKEVSSSTDEIKENIKFENEDTEAKVVPVPETEYDPSKAGYEPVRDACWARGAAVPYLALARTFERIEQVSARLKIIDILANYFRSVIALTPDDLLPSVYLCLNQLAPAYHSLELGIAETYLLKAVSACTGRALGALRGALAAGGELGALAEAARAAQRTMFPRPPLRVRAVFAALKDIAHMTGHASVNKKISKIQTLYVATRHSEARYLIRSLEGKLRIGLAEQSVLAALALAAARTPPGPRGARLLDAAEGLTAEQFKARVDAHALAIKSSYCACPNFEELLGALLAHGAARLPELCRLRAGVPLKPMLAHPTKGVHEVFNRFEGCEFTCEWKYDGERAQVHVPARPGGEAGEEAPDFENAAIFSRNQENNTSKYPDILRRLPSLLKPGVSSCVLDCEAVAYDTVNKQILPFQILSTRKRKDCSEADVKVQVCVFVFDVLLLNGRALVREPLAARRALLREHFAQVEGEWQFATSKDCTDMEEVQAFLEEAVRGSCEGLMVKTLNGDHAQYDIARRSHNWLKLKKDYLEGVGDTIDAVVIGAYHGRGRRRALFGGFLAACWDPATETYQSLCKLGTGFTDEDLASLTETLKTHEIPQPRNYYSFDSSHAPDAWFAPACVWELRCADLSLSPAHRAALGLLDPDKGVSLRFPRFVRVRTDKSPEQATAAQQLASMYLAQVQVRNNTGKTVHAADDFY